ncbi:MAG: DUF6788 family protein [Acidimicrobiales bacterium]
MTFAAPLRALGLPGTVAVRTYRCGKSNCACHADPSDPHGPYFRRSRQVNGKMVHANLSTDQLAGYRTFFDDALQLRGLLRELSLAMVESNPRWKRR